MRTTAAVLRDSGRARPYTGSAQLSIEDLELSEPGPGEVLVRVAAAGLCHSDISVIDGSRPRPLPMVLGHEASGVVEAVGPAVTRLRPGDHVVFSWVPSCGRCAPCQSGRPALCEPGAAANAAGTLLGGGRRLADGSATPINHHMGVAAFATHAVTAEQSLVLIDPHLPLDTAALIGCAVLTGYGAVVNTARVTPGSSVAVFGLGGVGLSVVMSAALAGCRPIVAVDPIEEKRNLAAALGATAAVKDLDELREALPAGADFAFEAAGSAEVLGDAFQHTARGGTTVAIGLPHPSRQLSIPAATLVAEERRLVGSYMGSAAPQRDIPRLVALAQAGRLPVDRLRSRDIGLEDLNDACELLASGHAVRQLIRFDR